MGFDMKRLIFLKDEKYANCISESIDINRSKELIEEYKLISFDIFGTLLLRSVDKPTDVFIRIEEEYGAKGFADARIQAERKARIVHKGNEDITLDQIYEEIDDAFSMYKPMELRAEQKYTYANEVVKQLYDYAHLIRKKTVICSDMYLSKSFLTELLQSKGFDGEDKIFVSSDYLKSKATGGLFRYLSSDTGVATNEILHIGDNFKSDGNSIQCTMGYIDMINDHMTYMRRKGEGIN